jgi:hypothetical protein
VNRWAAAVVLAAMLVGCGSESGGSQSEGSQGTIPAWLSFDRNRPKEPTDYDLYFDVHGRYLSCVATGHPTQAEVDASMSMPGVPADSLLRAGPRMVGEVPNADHAALERLSADDRWAIYESEPESAGPRTDGSDTEYVSFTRWLGAMERVTFVRDRVQHPETGEMIDTLLEMHHRLHLAGTFMDPGDAEVAAQQVWPVP